MPNEKIALVTGSSKGIGGKIAYHLALSGYFVYLTYFQDRENGEKAVQKIEDSKHDAKLLQLNVRDEQSVKQVINQIKREKKHLNVLVNNAGIDISKKIEEVTFKEWKDVTETKINGNFLCTKYALPLMKKQDNANIIIIVSSLGDRPEPQFPAYCVGTAGTVAFMKMMALDLGKYNIRVNGISPGTTKTAMWDIESSADPKLWENFAKGNPLGRVPTTDDIAKVTMMIINDETKYLNGNIIYVNGGNHLK